MILTLAGSNDFARKAALHEIIAAFVAEHGDLALERIDASTAELGRLLDMVASLPFLSARRMVVLDEPSKNKSLAEHIAKLIEATGETTDLILVEPKPDKRSVYYKTLVKQTEMRDFPEVDQRNLGSWLVAEAKKQGGTASLSDANYLVERVGANQLILYHELEKLLTYEPTVTRATIDMLTEPAPQSTIFSLLDAAFTGNHQRAMHLYKEQRAQKVEPQQILAMLTWQLHGIALVKAAQLSGIRNPDDIAKQAKLSPYTVRKTATIASGLSMNAIKDLVARTLALDIRLKSEAINADDAVQHLLLSL